jgi:hypothetical protein
LPASRWSVPATGSEAPNTKLQLPDKLRAPNTKTWGQWLAWSLVFGVFPVFGAWNLELLWSLEFGIWRFANGTAIAASKRELVGTTHDE